MGYEAAGEIDALGKGADAPPVGTRVIVLSRFGAQAEKVCVPAQQVMEMPEGASFEDAAALPVVYLTAYHMLFRVAPLRRGRRVLVHMAAGGVGIAAIQLCKTVPDVEIFGTASPSKHDFLREIGCHHPIDYRSTDYAKEILRLTDGKGVDLVLDALGGRDWKKGFSLLRPAGHLVAFGFANMSSGQRRSILHTVWQAAGIPLYTPLGLMNVNKTVSGVNIGHLWGEIDMLSEELVELVALWKEGKIAPRVDAVVPFDRAAEAHGRLEGRQNVGKVVLVP
jgi:NADPH:quinone reductase-like Zn-dependent oxidoreductase